MTIQDFDEVGPVAYFIDGGHIRQGVLVNIKEPTDDEQRDGIKTLFEFGHGFATQSVYKTKDEAQSALEEL